MDRISSPGLLWKKIPSSGLLLKEDIRQVFCGEKKAFYEKKTFLKSSVVRRPLSGHLWTEDLRQVFYGKKIFVRFSMEKKSRQVFYGKKGLR